MDDMDVTTVFANLNLRGADGSTGGTGGTGGSGGGRSGDGEVPTAAPAAPTLTSRAARGASSDPKTVPHNGASPGQKIVAYVDGACKGNHKPAQDKEPSASGTPAESEALAGIGVWWDLKESQWPGTFPKNVSERLPGKQTNNRAELYAILRALERDPDPTAKFKIKTSSEYSVNGATKGCKPGAKNQDLIKAILALKKKREDYCRDGVEIVHVGKGSEDINQREASKLADVGTREPEREEREFGEIQREGGYEEFKRLS